MRSKLLASTLALAVAGACAKKSDEPATAAPPPVVAAGKASAKPAETDSKMGLSGEKPVRDHRKVIRTGRLDLLIDDYNATHAKLAAVLEAAGGYIDSTEVAHHQGAVGKATIVVRIPSEAFATVLPKLRALGDVGGERTAAEDITDQYVDLSARLESAKTLEKRLLELASNRTANVDRVLAVERELARVRGEIEGYEGRLRQWNDQIAMSTLTVELVTRAPVIAATPDPERGLGDRIASAFASSVEALRAAGTGIAVSAIALAPWLVFLVPGALLGRRLWRRRRPALPRAVVEPRMDSGEAK